MANHLKLLKVEDNVFYVKGFDTINGTPVLDIKPYIEKVEEKNGKNKWLRSNPKNSKLTVI